MIEEYFKIEAVAAKRREDITGSAWAEKYRVLTSVTSGIPGPYRCDIVKIAKGVLDAVTSDNAAEVAWCSGTQNAKTETMLNALGYIIHQTPAPVMIVYPEKDDAKFMSKIRLADMIENARDGVLTERVELSEKRKDIFNIPFVGGLLTLAWSTNVNKLAGKPIKYLFLDEIDKYEPIQGHGSPLSLARERQKAFPQSRLFMASSPTYEEGAIWQAIHEADYLFKYYVPCPLCREKFLFGIEGLKEEEGEIVYKCPLCNKSIKEEDKNKMISQGDWLTEKGENLKDVISSGYRLRLGFWSSSFYSPFVKFSEIYKRFNQAKDNPEDMRVFVNGWLGLPYDDTVTGVEQSAEVLLNRCEEWDALPLSVCCLTCGVDVQKNRLEVLVIGWGIGRESWIIDRRIIYGDPKQQLVWKDLEYFISEMKYKHSSGAELYISCTAIDSGFLTDEVYLFCHNKGALGVYAVKGGSRPDLPAVSLPRSAGVLKTPLFVLGVHNLKTTIFYWLLKDETGPGYIHFKKDLCDLAFFEQLTAERLTMKTEKGKRVEQWEKVRERNEALDLVVYNFAALYILNPPLEQWAERVRGIK